MTYATKDQFKHYVDDPKVASSDTFDTLIQQILGRTDELINGWTNRPKGFYSTDAGVVRTFDVNVDEIHENEVRVRRMMYIGDCQSISLVRTRWLGTGQAFETVASADYFLRPLAHELPDGWPYYELHLSNWPLGTAGALRISYFTPGYDTLEITGKWGWAAVPKDIEEAALEIAVRLFRSRGVGFSDAIGVSTDSGDNLIFFKALPLITQAIIYRYRWPGNA